jgi:capsular exopolysaccharide synthesis family protein
MAEDMVDFAHQWSVLRRRWKTVLLAVTVFLVAAAALGLVQPPRFSASAEVLLAPTGPTDDAGGEVLAPEEVSTQVAVVKAMPVSVAVKQRLHLSLPAADLLDTVTVEQVEDRRVLSITAVRPTAQGAAQVANAFAEIYLQQRSTLAAEQARASTESLQVRYAELQGRLTGVQSALASADPTRRVELQSQEQALTVQLTQLLGQLADAEAAAGVATANGGQILVPAVRPSAPAEPRPVRLGLLGVFAGLLVGLGLAFLRDRVDDVVREEGHLRESLPQVPVLGRIPRIPKRQGGPLVTVSAPHSLASESFRALSSTIRFLLAASRTTGPNRPSDGWSQRVLLITSAGPGEGKTTVAANLAVAAARVGLRVVLLDADLRKPGVSEEFGLGDAPGLSDLLADRGQVEDYLLDFGVPGLHILAAGSIPPNPGELLASGQAHQVLEQLRQRCDLVVVDSAPVTRVADTCELIPVADRVVLVTRRGVTHAHSVADAVERIRHVGGAVSGTVFNDVEADGIGTVGYGAGAGRSSSNREAPSGPPGPGDAVPLSAGSRRE